MQVFKPLAMGGITVGLLTHYESTIVDAYLEAVERARSEETGHLI